MHIACLGAEVEAERKMQYATYDPGSRPRLPDSERGGQNAGVMRTRGSCIAHCMFSSPLIYPPATAPKSARI